MGRHSKDDAQRIGPRLWGRFLKRHFACQSLASLNAQLPLPIAPHEIFEFGTHPIPMPERIAPKLFERAYDLGHTPDGAYTTEIDNTDLKFNLYERVSQRVPESRHWLLKDLEPFLRPDLPPIDTSVLAMRRLLAELKLLFPERNAVVAWSHVDLIGLKDSQKRTIDGLLHTPLPECLALIYSLCHLSIWRQPPHDPPRPFSVFGANLSHRLLTLSYDAARSFAHSLTSHGFDDSGEIGLQIANNLSRATTSICKYGARSMSSDDRLPDLDRYVVLVPDTSDTREAILCLTEASTLGRKRSLWAPTDSKPGSFSSRPPAQHLTSRLSLTEAAALLRRASIEFSVQMRARVSTALGGYQGIWLKQQPSVGAETNPAR